MRLRLPATIPRVGSTNAIRLERTKSLFCTTCVMMIAMEALEVWLRG